MNSKLTKALGVLIVAVTTFSASSVAAAALPRIGG